MFIFFLFVWLFSVLSLSLSLSPHFICAFIRMAGIVRGSVRGACINNYSVYLDASAVVHLSNLFSLLRKIPEVCPSEGPNPKKH